MNSHRVSVRHSLKPMLGAMLSVSLLWPGQVAWAGSLAAVPMTMTPIYTSTAIGLIGIDAARRTHDRVYGSSSSDSSDGRFSRSGGRSRTSSPPAVPQRFDFGADRAASAQVKAQFTQLVKTHMGEQAGGILGFYERKPVRKAYLEAASRFGLSDHDLRDVLTAYLVAGWMVGNQRNIPTVAQVQGARAQVGRALQQKPLPANTPVQRQVLAEQMMYDLTLMVAANTEDRERHDAEALRGLASATLRAYQRKGIDLRRMMLTDDGFKAI